MLIKVEIGKFPSTELKKVSTIYTIVNGHEAKRTHNFKRKQEKAN